MVVLASNGDELLEVWPDAELTKLADCGHVLVQEKTAVVIQTTRAFLDRK